MPKPALAILTLALVLTGPAFADETTLAAGAGFRRPLSELAQGYSAQSGHDILQIYGHVGQVLAQARESDEIALVCGDKAVMANAEGIEFDRWIPLGTGKLVVAFRKGVALEGARDVADPALQRIGIPDQAAAIYGRAGRQFLERSGLAGAVEDRLVPVATVPQVTSYVASGNVDAGFVNATDAIGAGDGIGGFVAVPADLYDPVEVACGIRTDAGGDALAGFAAYLETPEARTILDRYGL